MPHVEGMGMMMTHLLSNINWVISLAVGIDMRQVHSHYYSSETKGMRLQDDIRGTRLVNEIHMQV